MSHTNSTTNYNLPQFLSTDKPAWMADINVAFSDIDTAIKDAADDATAAQTTGDAAELNFAPGYSNASTYAVGDIVTYNDRLYKCDVAVTVAEDWNGNKWSLYRVSDLKEAVENVVSAENALETLVGSTDISAIGDGSVTGAIDTINTNLSVNDLSSKVSTITTNFTVNVLTLKQIGHLYIVDFNCNVVTAFNGGVARLLIQFDSDFTPANFRVVSVCNHLNSSAIVKGIARVYSSSDGLRIMTKENGSTGDIIQGQIIFTA